jgi:hypothetical protein
LILNKHEIGHPELTKIKQDRPNVLVIGDSLSDANMATGTDNVFRIRIYDPRPDEARNSAGVRTQTLELFDVLLQGRTLTPVCELVRSLAA